jgi:hypothetical protein
MHQNIDESKFCFYTAFFVVLFLIMSMIMSVVFYCRSSINNCRFSDTENELFTNIDRYIFEGIILIVVTSVPFQIDERSILYQQKKIADMYNSLKPKSAPDLQVFVLNLQNDADKQFLVDQNIAIQATKCDFSMFIVNRERGKKDVIKSIVSPPFIFDETNASEYIVRELLTFDR